MTTMLLMMMMITARAARVLLYSVMFVCDFVCLSVNAITHELSEISSRHETVRASSRPKGR